MQVLRYSLLFLGLIVPAYCADKDESALPPAEDYFKAIRANDLTTLRTLCKHGAAGVTDRLDWTPLHYAALFGSTESVQIVLDEGGDPNARNKSQATPLILASYSFDKTRMLAEKGADVNAKASDGSTALWVASGAPGNEKTVRYLIAKGADPKATRPNGGDYLMRVAEYQQPDMVRFLLDQGLDPHASNKSGDTALHSSLECTGDANAQLLIGKSDINAATQDAGRVKNGAIDSFGLTPLMFAASCGDVRSIQSLIKAGANLNAVDHRHMTALMMSAAIDRASPQAVRMLIEAGADLNVADRNAETALDWARKYRNPEIVAMLEKAGARAKGLYPDPARPADYKPDAREAIARASALLAKSNETFFREGGGCIGCHHQPFGGRAYAAVKDAGLPLEPRLRRILVDGVIAESPSVLSRLPYLTASGGGYDSFLYPLIGMKEMGEPASTAMDVMVHYIAELQEPDGSWSGPGSRPPLQESSFTRTMLAISALKGYGWPARQPEFEQRIARAKTWLLLAKAYTTVDESDRLMGLWLAEASPSDLRKAANAVLGKQHPDGGWAQTPYLDSDAFGTSAALYTLRKTGFLKVSDTAYENGARYLLNTQFPDGSWFVRSRVVKLQPYFQSAFPFDHDQWISNTATSYAVMALAPVAAAEVR